MDERDGEVLRFRDFEIDARGFQVLSNGKPVPMERRVYDLVLYLIRHRNRLVTKDELLEAVWRQSSLSDSAVARCVSTARRAFGDPDCIQNVYGRGYRWTVPVAVLAADVGSSAVSDRQAIRTGIFGRDRELDFLESLVARAGSGEGGVCLVSGDAGIGKTRFLRAVRDIALGKGFRAFVGRSREMEGTPPYLPWSQIVRGLYDSEPLPETVRLVFASAEDTPSMAEEPFGESRMVVWEALADAIFRKVRSAPTALLLDDLHHADIGSTLLAEFVAEKASEAPLLLLAAYRSVELARDPVKTACLHRMIRSAAPLTLELRGLTVDQTESLLFAKNGQKPSAGAVSQVHRLTGGNPYFLEQIAPALASMGDGWDTRALVRELPRTVRASIEGQLVLVSPACRSMLELCSVIGRVVPLSIASAALGIELADFTARVTEAGANGLVAFDGDSSFSFVHDLVREVVYEGLSPFDRSRFHLLVAQAMERFGQGERGRLVDEIAHHYANAVHAGGAARALDYALRAAHAALTRFAYEDARDHLARAVDIIEETRSSDTRALCAVLVDLGSAELNSGNDGAAWAAFERAADLARALGETEPLMRIALSLTSSFHAARADYDPRLVRLLEELLARTDRTQPAVRAQLLSRLIFTLSWLPDQARRGALAREAHQLALQVHDPRVHASVAVARCVSFEQPGDLSERLRVAEDAVGLCRVAGDFEIAQFAHVARLLCRLEATRLDGVREDAEACRKIIHRLRMRHGGTLMVPLAHAGLLAHIDGRLEDLDHIALDCDTLGKKTGNHALISLGDTQRAVALFERGHAAEVGEIARKWSEFAPTMTVWSCFLTRALARAGRWDEARALLRSFTDGRLRLEPDWQWLGSTAMLAEAASLLGEADSIRLLYDELLPYADRGVSGGVACFYLGCVHRYLGLLAGEIGRFDVADEHFERANSNHAATGARLMHAHTLAEHAILLECAPDAQRREKAKGLRARAAELADEMGLVSVQSELSGSVQRRRRHTGGGAG